MSGRRTTATPAKESAKHGWGKLGERLDAIEARQAVDAEIVQNQWKSHLRQWEAIEALEAHKRALDDAEAARLVAALADMRRSRMAMLQADERAQIAKTFASARTSRIRRTIKRAKDRLWKWAFGTTRSAE